MRRAARVYLIAVSILNGLAGLVCGVLFIASPDGSLMGFEPLLPVVRALPFGDIFFRDLVWIGIALLLVLGVPNLAAAVMLLRRSAIQYHISLAAAILLVLWCAFELAFMFNAGAVGYLIVGAVSALSSGVLLRATARTSV